MGNGNSCLKSLEYPFIASPPLGLVLSSRAEGILMRKNAKRELLLVLAACSEQ
ncbi:hypothetical protein FHS15_001015 [Paenibacillus castaneae]|nr:hypothetical protein [Paenibacillus castaneae]